ncbi:hypothetical protein G7054_g2387 [Neopestalotiopsis clavispora]|nr:hypothetical protein G7054_g2387 [Neopestalotiopsis clavispora]
MNSRSMSDHDSPHIQSEYIDYHSLPKNQPHVVARPLESELASYDFETPRRVAKDKRDNYKPTTLRLPFLAALLFSLLAMMGLLAYSLHALPLKEVVDNLLDQGDEVAERRGLYLDANPRLAARMPLTTTGSVTSGSKSSTSSIPVTTKTTSGAFGDIDTTVTPTGVSSPPSDAFGVISTTIIISGSSLSTTNTINHISVGGDEITTTVASTTSDAHGKAGQSVTKSVVTYVTEPVTTLTNSKGLATSTSTRVPSAISTPLTTTLTNSAGKPTTTITSNILATPITSAITNSRGVATATVVLYPSLTASTESPQVFYISPAEYFIGFCLPTLLSIIIAIPIRALNMNAKLFQPWHALTHPSGALGFESLVLPTCGFMSYANGMRSFLGGQILISLTTVLMMCSVLLVPLSAESIVLELRGNCVSGSAKGCTYQLSVSEIPAKATLALLALMCFLVVLIVFSLWRWKSGVNTNPWNICGVAGLAQNEELRALLTQDVRRRPRLRNGIEKTLNATVSNRCFKLGWFHGNSGGMEYGVMLADHHSEIAPFHYDLPEAHEEISMELRKDKNSLPFMLRYIGRFLFLIILVGLLALILYYNNTGDDTAFERFMDSQSFGTKFLFTSVGTIVTLFWSSFVSSVAIVSPYQLLSQRPQKAKHSILLSPPTNSFSSVLSGIRRRHVLLAVVGVTALLSEFLTIFLSNVPYRATQTFLAARICAYGSIGIIATMTLVVVSSLFVKWPHMPVDPSTIAGAMYYVCDSWMLRDLKHFGEMGRDDCNTRMNAMDQEYTYGEFVGQSGTLRIGVDTVDDQLHV